jgi:hypothetical protein
MVSKSSSRPHRTRVGVSGRGLATSLLRRRSLADEPWQLHIVHRRLKSHQRRRIPPEEHLANACAQDEREDESDLESPDAANQYLLVLKSRRGNRHEDEHERKAKRGLHGVNRGAHGVVREHKWRRVAGAGEKRRRRRLRVGGGACRGCIARILRRHRCGGRRELVLLCVQPVREGDLGARRCTG